MLMVVIWNNGLSDESVEDMANSNLHVMRFLEFNVATLNLVMTGHTGNVARSNLPVQSPTPIFGSR